MSNLPAPPWDSEVFPDAPLSTKARRLADEIFAKIGSGEYALGTRLPAERQLAEDFGVSRTTVRQSLALLTRHSVIERRQGSGSVVRQRPARASAAQDSGGWKTGLSDLSQITSPLELGVVRSIIEPEMMRLAVLNMTSRDIERMQEIMAEMERVASDGEAFCDLDDTLRLHLATGSRNPLLLEMYRMVQHVGAKADWAVARRRALTPGRIRTFTARNRALCTAIANRDLEGTVEQTRLALADFHQGLVGGG